MSGDYEVVATLGDGVGMAVATEELEAAVRHVLEAEAVAAAEISLALLNDEAIAGLNEGYLAHEGATDVISFALHGAGERPLGDIYVGLEQAARQAEEMGIELREELLRLAVHGTLHVLGYDHPAGDDREGSPMYLRQEELLASFLERGRPSGR